MNHLNEIIRAFTNLVFLFRFRRATERIIFFSGLLLLLAIQIFFFKKLVTNTYILGYDSYLYSWVPEPQYTIATVRHPLISFLLLPLTLLYKLVAAGVGELHAFYTLYVFFDAVVCYAIVFIYRICYEIAGIGQNRSLLLTLLFCSFAHIIIQPFLFESYPISLLLLCLTLYITGKAFNKVSQHSAFEYGILLVLTAGVTITNAVKTGIAFLFTPGTVWSKIKWTVVTSLYFALVAGIVLAAEKKWAGKIDPSVAVVPPETKKSSGAGSGSSEPASEKEIGFLEFIRFDVNMVTSAKENFFGEAALFHTHEFKKDVQSGRDIYLPYENKVNYLFLTLLYVLVFLAALFSFREKFVQLILASFGIDVFLHLVCRFGIDEPYIYAAHWMFIIPILLSFLYKKVKRNTFLLLVDGLVLLLIVYFFYVNGAIFLHFVEYA